MSSTLKRCIMLVKTQVSSSICGQGELTGPMSPCHGPEEYIYKKYFLFIKQLISDWRQKPNRHHRYA
jgi:hypothetical protein